MMQARHQVDGAVAQAVDRIRAIERDHGVTRDSLEKIKSTLIGLARHPELFSESAYPCPATEDSLIYLISEDDDHRIALYLSTGIPGRTSPPHNHTTWAVIVGIDGEEENRLYERVDDGSVPGRGEIRETKRIVLRPGDGIALMPEDIHSIHVVSRVPTRHLHMYGLSIEHLPNRIEFDMKKGTYKVFPPSSGIRK
ncbi:MAG: cysteine dioxygenase [Acidiferrobacterales bacterium]|jgi:predicted metal-dependent enzyme (double-stranded beta helix superfamily)|nr:cysteine dioxygenase [Gammaproteobacteria bacterium]MCZ6731750.1 cysteine dioxygenase [Gammaproteobacteria bacterium]